MMLSDKKGDSPNDWGVLILVLLDDALRRGLNPLVTEFNKS